MRMDHLPRIVCTIGMHGSASTWVFNAAREILGAAAGEDAVLPFFADKFPQVPPEAKAALRADGKILLIKSHEGNAPFEDWLDQHEALRFLSIRDPRDATVSLMQRFGMALTPAAEAIARDGARLAHLAARGIPVWRYEDGFFTRPAALESLAARLGCPLSAELCREIMTRYSTEAVRAFAQNLDALPPERRTMIGPYAMDRITQILGPHIGDGAHGKFRALPPDVQEQLSRFFAPLLNQFGYAAPRA